MITNKNNKNKSILLGLMLVTLATSALAEDMIVHTTIPTGKELVGMSASDSRTYINGILVSDLHKNKSWTCSEGKNWTIDARDDLILKKLNDNATEQMKPAPEAIWDVYKDACSTPM
jgi:hypothetical protein